MVHCYVIFKDGTQVVVSGIEASNMKKFWHIRQGVFSGYIVGTFNTKEIV